MDNKPKRVENPPTGESRPPAPEPAAEEIGGVKGADPTRYGDWQHKGRVSDF